MKSRAGTCVGLACLACMLLDAHGEAQTLTTFDRVASVAIQREISTGNFPPPRDFCIAFGHGLSIREFAVIGTLTFGHYRQGDCHDYLTLPRQICSIKYTVSLFSTHRRYQFCLARTSNP